MKVLVTGGRGQLGSALVASAPPGVEVVATDRAALDITDRQAVQSFVADIAPQLIINAAAYTGVDKAETETELAFRINRDGAAYLAEAARQLGTRLIHISTDYVFDGCKSTPYKPDDAPNPLNAYGASKLAGEQAVRDRTEGAALIVRTAWVYSGAGLNFVKTMMRLLETRDEVRVVCDQIGSPTHAGRLASALWRFARHPDLRGIWHWTDAGVASWYDFAAAIGRLTAPPGGGRARVIPIASHEFPTASRRPPFSVLDKSATWSAIGGAEHWTSPLSELLRPGAA